MSRTILIVDDDPVQRRLLENAVNKAGFRAIMANDGEMALDVLDSPQGASVHLIVLDLVMPGLDGMGVLGRMRELGMNIPVIVQTAQGGIDTVVGAIRAGAFDFCVKPVSFERLKISMENALKLDAMEEAVHHIRKTSSGEFSFDDMIAQSGAMERVIDLGRRAAASKIPVLLEGESGVGKEVVARAIHGSSDRARKPFVAVNCGALPENLVESILFGHEKGAFTGANASHAGKFKEADGGTLFLDEVGELPLDVQVKLLRAIQEGEVDPVGGKRPIKVNFRLVSATNRSMIDMVTSGHFREDLYYRLNVFPIGLPPLRKRREDIAPLVRHLTARICLQEGCRNIRGIRSDALQLLEAHDWPGNVRQLENIIFRAIILCEGDELTVNDFPQLADLVEGIGNEGEAGASVYRFDKTSASHPRDTATDGETAHSTPLPQTDLQSADGKLKSLNELEEHAIRHAIEHHNGRMTRVARSLGIGRSTLYRKLKEYGIDQDADEALDSGADAA